MRPLSRPVSVLLGLLTTLALVTGCSSAAGPEGGEGEIVFAAVPSEEAQSLQQAYDPIVKLLERETGRTIRFQNVTNYAAVIEGMRSGQIQLAQFGPFSYVLARQQGVRITPVGAGIDEPGEQPGYLSYGLTRAGSPVRSLADYRGRKVCFVDPNSTSGYLYPTAGLLQAGIDPRAGVTPIFAGGHDASALAVASGQCDAGFAQESTVDKTEVAPDRKTAATGAFADTANVDYLRANGFCQGECRIGDDGQVAYVPVDDAFYNGVRDVCQVTRDPSCNES